MQYREKFQIFIQLLEIYRAEKLVAEPQSESEEGTLVGNSVIRFFHCIATELIHSLDI